MSVNGVRGISHAGDASLGEQGGSDISCDGKPAAETKGEGTPLSKMMTEQVLERMENRPRSPLVEAQSSIPGSPEGGRGCAWRGRGRGSLVKLWHWPLFPSLVGLLWAV